MQIPMSNITAIRNLAGAVTVEHFFSNVSDFEPPAHEVFVDFMMKIDQAIEDGKADEQVFNVFEDDDDDAPIAWEPFDDDTLESFRDSIASHYNNILRTSEEFGLVTAKEIKPFLL
jgi:hypothetical protein